MSESKESITWRDEVSQLVKKITSKYHEVDKETIVVPFDEYIKKGDLRYTLCSKGREINSTRIDLKENAYIELVYFDKADFPKNLREIVESYQVSNAKSDTLLKMNQQDHEKLFDLLVASNERLNHVFEKVPTWNMRRRIFASMKSIVNKALNDPANRYNDVMVKLNQKLDKIDHAQAEPIVSYFAKLKAPYVLSPNQEFSFTLRELLGNVREDVDFFEISSYDPFDKTIPTKSGEGILKNLSDEVSGSAFLQTGTYIYELYLSHYSYKESNTKSVKAQLMLEVGDQSKTTISLKGIIVSSLFTIALFIGFVLVFYALKRALQTPKKNPPRYITAREDSEISMTIE
uniref:Uncharacterized protein n=1 Tax=Euplotes harpa TaxID=151035 RepID=A0A7S3J3S7_9SPIT|mmetsp:Transcript_13025/g.15009  ORF Transcript_13025/g.15009 Transcript_13025/m.15009 type:complete len:346 (+) Transcript_13025:234-1271(+)